MVWDWTSTVPASGIRPPLWIAPGSDPKRWSGARLWSKTQPQRVGSMQPLSLFPSPLAFELLRLVLRTQPRSFGTGDLLASNPALKRWAILACPFWTARQGSSQADKRPRCPAYHLWVMTRLLREREFTLQRTSSCGLISVFTSFDRDRHDEGRGERHRGDEVQMRDLHIRAWVFIRAFPEANGEHTDESAG